MWAALSRFQDDLTLLEHYIEGLDRQDAVLALDPDQCGAGEVALRRLREHFKGSGEKTVYEYNTIIVSLYGHFERYVEDLIAEYMTRIALLTPNYDGLPERLRQQHLELSIALISQANTRRFAGAVKIDELVSRLHSCFSSPQAYSLNVQAFALHSANIRHSQVNEMLSRCGIGDIPSGLRSVEPLQEFLTAEDSERDVSQFLKRDDTVVFRRVDDLADRRNDVSHGVPTTDVLSRDLLRSYVGFLRAYADALGRVVFERTLPFFKQRAVDRGVPIRVFNNRVVCFELAEGELSVGDLLISETEDAVRPFKAGRVLRIEKDHVAFGSIRGGDGVNIGVEVAFGAKANHHVYTLADSVNAAGERAGDWESLKAWERRSV